MNAAKVKSLFNQIVYSGHVYPVNEPSLAMEVLTLGGAAELTGDPYNTVLFFYWERDSSKNRVKITEGGLDKATILPNGDIVLIDDEGNDFPVRLFKLEPVAAKSDW